MQELLLLTFLLVNAYFYWSYLYIYIRGGVIFIFLWVIGRLGGFVIFLFVLRERVMINDSILNISFCF